MKPKVLVADDSQIIQKVIRIALATENFEIVEALNEQELADKIAQVKPQLLLLDYNLSSERSGYELAKNARVASPQVKVIMMYATFDPIDENALKDAAVQGKITKPFDGNRLITLCRSLAETAAPVSDFINKKLDEPKREIKELGSFELEVAEQPVAIEAFHQMKEPSVFESMNEAPAEPWEISIPGVIGAAADGDASLPPIIGSSIDPFATSHIELDLKPTPVLETKKSSDVAVPNQDDLEYPDLNSPSSFELELKPKSSLISLDDLVNTPAPNQDFGERKLDLSVGTGTDTIDGVKNIESQILDEKEDDLWKADEFETVEELSADVIHDVLEIASDFKPMDTSQFDTFKEEDLPSLEPHTLKAIKGGFDQEKPETKKYREDDFIFQPEEKKTVSASSANPDELVNAIMKEIKPLVEKLVQDHCSQVVEKVAWEVIPQIAENLIKSELKKISDSIID